MPINHLNPYLYFNGDAAKAIQLYEKALGAKTEVIMQYGDAPSEMPTPPEAKNLVMHALLHVGGGTLMISDSTPEAPTASGNNVQVLLDFSDTKEMDEKFNALAATGKVTMPLADTFWGAHFGMLTDAFGVSWLFNCTLKKD